MCRDSDRKDCRANDADEGFCLYILLLICVFELLLENPSWKGGDWQDHFFSLGKASKRSKQIQPLFDWV